MKLSNFELYHKLAVKHYEAYQILRDAVDGLKKRIGIITVDDIDNEHLNPSRANDLKELKSKAALRQEEAVISVLFEAFAVESYVNNVCETLSGKKEKGTYTEGKYTNAYKRITGTDMPSDVESKKKLHQLFQLRNNLVHSHTHFVEDLDQLHEAILHLQGDGNITMDDAIDYVMDTLPFCIITIKGALVIFGKDENQ